MPAARRGYLCEYVSLQFFPATAGRRRGERLPAAARADSVAKGKLFTTGGSAAADNAQAMKAALFDLDGVVVNTEPAYTDFWREAGLRYQPHDPAFALRIKGQTLTHIFSTYFPDRPEAQQQLRADLTAFEAQMSYPLVAGVEAFLQRLAAAGVPAAIVTSSDSAKMRALAAARPDLLPRFACVLTAESVTRSKPAPDGYFLAAERLGVRSADCLVFEDSLGGLAAGRASGARVVALATTLSAERLAPLADRVVPDFCALRSVPLGAI